MSKAIYKPISVTGTYVIPVDWWEAPFSLGYAVEIASGSTASFTVNYSLSGQNIAPNAPNYGWTPIWFADANNGTSKSVSVTGSYTTPITALQFIFSAISGNVMLSILQGIGPR